MLGQLPLAGSACASAPMSPGWRPQESPPSQLQKPRVPGRGCPEQHVALHRPHHPLIEALVVLIFNPSCLPRGGRWPQWLALAPLPRDVLQPIMAGTGHPFIERAGGEHERSLFTGFPSGSPAWVPRGLGDRDMGAEQACGTGGAMVWAVPPAPLQMAAAAARECPGRRDPGLKANRRRAGGWEKGRQPDSLCPLPPGVAERGGSAAWRASPSPQQGERQDPLPHQRLLGAEELLRCHKGTPQPPGHPGHADCAG